MEITTDQDLRTVVCPEPESSLLARANSIPRTSIKELLAEDPSVEKYLTVILGVPAEKIRSGSVLLDIRLDRILNCLCWMTNLSPAENAVITTARIAHMRKKASRTLEMQG